MSGSAVRVALCVSAYDDAWALAESLPAMRAALAPGDVMVGVDGRYADFPGEGGASTDGTLEALRASCDLVVGAPDRGRLPWPGEIEKRTAYLDAVGREAPDAVVLVVDADEAPEGGLDRARVAAASDWLVRYRMEDDPTNGEWIHRLFRWRPGILYRGTHHAVHVGDRMVRPGGLPRIGACSTCGGDGRTNFGSSPCAACRGGAVGPGGFRLRHFRTRRPAEREERKQAYYRKLVPKERDFRAEHGL